MRNTGQIEPGFDFGERRIFGVDEAGRGAMAGPLSVAAVEYPWPGFEDYAGKVRDSKRMTPKSREAEAALITAYCKYACVMIDPEWIDLHGIQAAETEGLIQVVTQLAGWGAEPGAAVYWPDMVVCDGTADTWGLAHTTLGHLEDRISFMIGGDKHVPAISAASIVAKTMRDALMKTEMHDAWPQYGFNVHVGYVTALHLSKLDEFGASPIHRHSVRPVKERDARDS